jgi:hypothetical protein
VNVSIAFKTLGKLSQLRSALNSPQPGVVSLFAIQLQKSTQSKRAGAQGVDSPVPKFCMRCDPAINPQLPFLPSPCLLVYTVTDSQQVKEEVKAIFGNLVFDCEVISMSETFLLHSKSCGLRSLQLLPGGRGFGIQSTTENIDAQANFSPAILQPSKKPFYPPPHSVATHREHAAEAGLMPDIVPS